MISEFALDIFDALQWMGSAEKVAERYPSTQPTVSRTARRCAKVFDVAITRSSGEYIINSSTELLLRTRRLHQAVRWNSGKLLRIDAYHYYHSIYFSSWIEGTLYGTLDLLNAGRIASLIRDSVVDCWLATGPDVPTNDPELSCIPLAESPLFLFALTSHPLLQQANPTLSLEEATVFPLLTYGRHLMPETHKQLEKHFKQTLPSISGDRFNMAAIIKVIQRNPSCIIAATESDFASAPRVEQLITKPLEIQLPLSLKHQLLVRREYSRHPRLLSLVDILKDRVQRAAKQYSSLQLL